jgi:hypothetical protein
VARTWLSVRVDLISGHGDELWPRPGRIFAAARSHKFSQLADAIDTAFARWDRSHLYKFELADGRLIGQAEFDDFDLGFIGGAATTLSTLALGEQFVYEFDFGDSWTHLCTVGPARIDPESEVGIVPRCPLPYWGWGAIPDQYGRRWDCDDWGEPAAAESGVDRPAAAAAVVGAARATLGRRLGVADGVVFVGHGERSLMLVWRRRGLYQASIHSKIAWDSWCLVSHRVVSSSSRCIVDQNDSIIVLSTEEANRPIDPSRPA